MNKRTPEALVAHLRRRKFRITFYAIVAVVLAVFAAAWGYLSIDFTTMLFMGPTSEGIEDKTVVITFMGPLMASAAASCFAACLAHSIGFGFALAALITELTSYTKNQLLVEMWDRIKELQSKNNK
jgi:hypothetical protein